ncbi:hypothetical protein [Azoarcus olearius]|uniref:Hypothetical secreted protein n=1 Tax=Azoarcus sp. (strain BH72) TaxID=418699 RepID=A1K806_AZOSB|nr:hypothetical protein [Azoarcus olearius]CAL94961.1 hypothetical secreted protein [Azoarcus olearius]
MRKFSLVFAFFMALASGVFAAVAQLDSDLMQAVEDTNKSLSSNLLLKNAPASLTDVRELDAMFAEIEGYYVAKGDAADAVELSRKSRALAAEIQKSVQASEFDHAVTLSSELSRTCKTCHNFYKKS